MLSQENSHEKPGSDDHIPSPSRAKDVIEEAKRYKRLIERYGSQEKVALKCRVTRSSIAQKLRLLSLPKKAQDMIAKGLITAKHGRALLIIPWQFREQESDILPTMTANHALEWAQERAKELGEALKEKSTEAGFVPKDADWHYMEKNLREALKTKIEVIPTGGGGAKIKIQAFTKDKFEEIYQSLLYKSTQ